MEDPRLPRLSRWQRVVAASSAVILAAGTADYIAKSIPAGSTKPPAVAPAAPAAPAQCGAIPYTAEAAPLFSGQVFSSFTTAAGRLVTLAHAELKSAASSTDESATGKIALQNCDVVTVTLSGVGELTAESGSLSLDAEETDAHGTLVREVEASITGSTARLEIIQANGTDDLFVWVPGMSDELCETTTPDSFCVMPAAKDVSEDGDRLLSEANATFTYWVDNGDGSLPQHIQYDRLEPNPYVMPYDL